jgi:hypothetical protein
LDLYKDTTYIYRIMVGISKNVLMGTLDENSTLSKLRGNALALSRVCDDIEDWIASHIHRDPDAYSIMDFIKYIKQPNSLFTDCERSTFVDFPESTGININMMPFKLYDPNTLPKEYHGYIPMIKACRTTCAPVDTIAYLTIQESDVLPGMTQRRPGIHIESPCVSSKEANIIRPDYDGRSEYMSLAWGRGHWNGYVRGGIYMASSQDNTTRIWPIRIEKPEEVVDKHGGLEHLKDYLGDAYTLKANELCWFTDRTPHESLPVTSKTHRQFFRLVVGEIDVWYSQHNTPNPLGIMPNAMIVDKNKFE